jgi:hypothetical protein
MSFVESLASHWSRSLSGEPLQGRPLLASQVLLKADGTAFPQLASQLSTH